MTGTWRRLRKIFVHNVLHADDTPHRIAIGVAAGLFAGFLPTPALQTVVAIAMAALVRGNKLVAIPMVWITNPVTFLPIYSLCYYVGHGLVGTRPNPDAPEATTHVVGPVQQLLDNGISSALESSFWHEAMNSLTRIGVEMWVGCSLVGFITGTIGYFATRWAVVHYRARHHHLLAELAAQRRARRAARERTKSVHAQGPAA